MRLAAWVNSLRTPVIALVVASILSVPAFLPGAPATHGDGFYDGPVWFDWDHTDIDVVIIPPEHGQWFNDEGIHGGPSVDEANPCASSYLRAILDAIQGWQDAIDEFGASWLKSSLDISVHVVGCDAPQTPTLDPEIIIYTDLTKGPVLGFALINGFHEACISQTSKFGVVPLSFTEADLFNTMSHEFGHCLGANHTGDLDGGSVGDPGHPDHDVMEGRYEHDIGAAGNHRHCVSNLNVKVIEAAFNGVPGPSLVTIAVGDYDLSSSPLCNNG